MPFKISAKLCAVGLAVAFIGACGKRSAIEKTDEQLKQEIETAFTRGSPAGALDPSRTLATRYPEDFDTIGMRAGVLLLAGQGQAAKEVFESIKKMDSVKATELQTFLCDRAIWKARELSGLKPPAQALSLLGAVLTIFPDATHALHDRGALRLETGDYKGAIEDLSRAIKLNGGGSLFGDSHLLRAEAREKLGDAVGAAEDRAASDKRAGRDRPSGGKVEIEIDGTLTDRERKNLISYLMRLVDDPAPSVSSMELSSSLFVTLEPVKDPTNFLAKLSIGKIKQISPRRVRMSVTGEELEQLIKQSDR